MCKRAFAIVAKWLLRTTLIWKVYIGICASNVFATVLFEIEQRKEINTSIYLFFVDAESFMRLYWCMHAYISSFVGSCIISSVCMCARVCELEVNQSSLGTLTFDRPWASQKKRCQMSRTAIAVAAVPKKHNYIQPCTQYRQKKSNAKIYNGKLCECLAVTGINLKINISYL